MLRCVLAWFFFCAMVCLLRAEQGKQSGKSTSQTAVDAPSKEDFAAARAIFQQRLAAKPNDSTTLANLGMLEYRQQNLDEAARLLKKAVRVDPDLARAWLTLGVVEYERNDFDAALAALSHAVLLEPKSARAHNYLGVTIGRKGWLDGAQAELRTAVELAPDYAEAHFNLALSYLQQAPPAIELARRHYQRALDLGAARDDLVEKRLEKP
jgi:tetratricopeptide (TPR) repeat protein